MRYIYKVRSKISFGNEKKKQRLWKNKWDKVFKSGLSGLINFAENFFKKLKPLKNLLSPILNTLSQMLWTAFSHFVPLKF